MAEQKVMKLATRPMRFLSALVDSLIIGFIPMFLAYIFGGGIYGFAYLVVFGVQIYFYVHGQSIAKKIFGLRVVSEEDGKPLGAGYMLLREFILKPVINAFFCIGYIWILIDDRNCGLYDKILNALVIDERDEEENIDGHYRTITEGNVTVAPTDDPIKDKVSYTMTADEARAQYKSETSEKPAAPVTAETAAASEASEAPETSAASEAPETSAASEAPKAADSSAEAHPETEKTAEPEIRTASSYLDDMKN